MSESVESLSQPVSEDSPSGENLEYDPLFLEMEKLLRPRSESMVEEGADTVDEIDWRAVEKCTRDLRERTRDLRIQVNAAIAALNTKGIEVFRDNLGVLHDLVDGLWDSVHPQLDPDDNNDPTLRMSTLQVLDDHRLVVMPLERVKLAELKGVGAFGARDADLALGREMAGRGEEVPDLNLVRQAFLTADQEQLAATATAVSDSQELLRKIDTAWRAKTEDPSGLDFAHILKALGKISTVIDEFKPTPAVEGDGTAATEPGGQAAPAAAGAVTSRADVIRVLDKVCEYYQVHEPSSPIPLLLRRAQRLVEKSFMEILEDMVPDGVNQARLVSGERDKS
jgi:type VI secretion system protein ImpA